MKPHEVLVRVLVPFTSKFEYVKEFKQAHRRDDDIAIVNAGMRFKLAHSDTGTLSKIQQCVTNGVCQHHEVSCFAS